jgi:hypothetical protein
MKSHYLIALAASSVFFMRSHAQQIEVRGGNKTLSITTAVVGSEPTPVTNATGTLRYRRQSQVTKITVQTSCPSQAFTLKVLAQSVPLGTAAPEVTLTNGMPATNFIVNIPAGSNTRFTCTLRYTASVTFSQGNSAELGNDVHNVVYTLVRQ